MFSLFPCLLPKLLYRYGNLGVVYICTLRWKGCWSYMYLCGLWRTESRVTFSLKTGHEHNCTLRWKRWAIVHASSPGNKERDEKRKLSPELMPHEKGERSMRRTYLWWWFQVAASLLLLAVHSLDLPRSRSLLPLSPSLCGFLSAEARCSSTPSLCSRSPSSLDLP
jgi:hypothetical protein